ncbi:MAG: BatD family protein [Bacteroidales bacterium]|nr:BatD family protein [Bacteroidales bacterium]
MDNCNGRRGITNRALLVILFMLMSGMAPLVTSAQGIQFTAAARHAVSVGEQFRLTFTVNADGRDFKAPALGDFNVLSGPNPSTSSSIQIINGQVSRSVTLSYTFILQAIKEGEFQIQPAVITVDGKQFESNPLTIKVSAAGGQSPQSQPSPPSGIPKKTEELGDVGQSDVFVRTSVDKKNPYQGEEIIVSHKIYTRVGISQYGVEKFPSYNGFWTQELQNLQEEPNKHNEIINGQEYLVAEINKVALFPMKNGSLTIEPLELNIVAQVRKSSRSRSNDPFDIFFNDPFFGGGYQNVQKRIASNPVTIDIKPLPAINQPADFKGVVGKYTFKSNIDKTDVEVNEAINLKFTVLGEGNIKLIDELSVSFPPDFEVYDPKTSFNLNKNKQGISGVKTFEYLIIPRNPGSFKIKPVVFSYFDPDQGTYVSQASPAYDIDVHKGTSSGPGVTYSGVVQEDVQYIGSDIRHIKNNPVVLKPTGKSLFGSLAHILLIIVPLSLAVFVILFVRQQMRKRSNIHWMKTQKATKVARMRLKLASTYLKSLQEKEFYNEVSQALWGYISDKFNLPLADLSMDSVYETLKNKNIKDAIIEQFIETLNHCEYARFAPGGTSQNMDKIYEEALNVISKTERELK